MQFKKTTDPIKVLVISNYNQFHAVRPEAEIFLGLKQLGFDIHIMTFGNSEYARRFRKAGITVINWHPKKKLNKKEIRFIRAWLIRERYDILQLFNSTAILNGIQAAHGLPVKVVLYRGAVSNIHWWDPFAYLKYLHPRVDRIVCNSAGTEELFHRQLFFNKHKTIVINKGHNTDWYQGILAKDLRSDFGIPEEATVFISVANHQHAKGIPFLLRTINQLPPDLPFHLVLVGRDLDTLKHRNILTDGPNSDRVHFAGFREDALQCIAGADVLVLSSLYGESLTKAVIEAMAMKKAPIISKLPGNRELVINGENGIVYPAGDTRALKKAIISLCENRELRIKYGKQAKEHLEVHLNLSRTILEYRDFYVSLSGK